MNFGFVTIRYCNSRFVSKVVKRLLLIKYSFSIVAVKRNFVFNATLEIMIRLEMLL